MNDMDLYMIRRPGWERYPKFNYYFDKMTCAIIGNRKGGLIKNPKKVLLIRNDHIGDMVYATATFRELKKAFPNVEITVIADPRNKMIIEKDKYVDKIIEIDLFWRRKSVEAWLDYFRVLRKIRKEEFDVGFDLRRSKLNIFLFLFLGRVKNRVSHYNVNGGKAFLTHPLLYEKRILNNLEHLDQISKVFGIKPKDVMPHVMTDEKDEKEGDDFLKKNKIGKKFIIILPGSTEVDKQWPIEKVSEFIRRFSKRHGNYKIIVSSGPGDRELVESLCIINKKVCVPEIGDLSLRGLGEIMKKAGALIANNGAGTDIGWTVGGNLVALAGGTVDLTIHMPQRKSKVLQPKMPRYPYPPAIKMITVDEVMKAVDEFLEDNKEKR
jgi:ADP-heptose:LPS heptosyltransferase